MPFEPYWLTLAQVDGEGDSGGDARPANADATDATESQDASGGDGPPQQPGGLFSGPMFWVMLLGMIVLWVFLLGGGQRKQKKRQAEMLASLSKGAKIVTIGGIRGSVVEVRDDEVLVKVDESANTRLRFSRDAIRSVLEDKSAS